MRAYYLQTLCGALAGVVLVIRGAAAAGDTPVANLRLTTDANGGGQSLTNLNRIIGVASGTNDPPSLDLDYNGQVRISAPGEEIVLLSPATLPDGSKLGPSYIADRTWVTQTFPSLARMGSAEAAILYLGFEFSILEQLYGWQMSGYAFWQLASSNDVSESSGFYSAGSNALTTTPPSHMQINLEMEDNAADTVVVNSGSIATPFASLGHNTSVMSTPGRIGNALNFDGTSDAINCPSFSRPAGTALTLSMWAYIRVYPDPDVFYASSVLFNFGPSGDWGWFWMQLNSTYAGYGQNGELHFAGTANTSPELYAAKSAPFAVASNAWVHLAGTADGTNALLYYNGSCVATSSISGTGYGNAATSLITIGKEAYWGWNLDGIVDQVRVYDIAMSEAQIAELYNGGAGTTTDSTAGTPTNATIWSTPWSTPNDIGVVSNVLVTMLATNALGNPPTNFWVLATCNGRTNQTSVSLTGISGTQTIDGTTYSRWYGTNTCTAGRTVQVGIATTNNAAETLVGMIGILAQ